MEKKFVVPGEFLGVQEEYLAGEGTFIEGETIRAAVCGSVSEKDRKISVAHEIPLRAFGIGSTIIGRVENIVEPVALVSMRISGSLTEEDERFGENPDYAILHASMIKKGYVRNVRDEYKIGDIIRAKIVDMRNGEMRLSTDAEELGVIKAFCNKCRHPMRLEGRILKCEKCRNIDNRKIAKDYRKAII
ncbi:MAG: exosome complex RNA-binding protein Csl4 [Candidatus Micrarchaeota archaeon]|nr:exosome complex RNA-binding protein Csl4 [Candidatus Micrarchaeota archaeon]